MIGVQTANESITKAIPVKQIRNPRQSNAVKTNQAIVDAADFGLGLSRRIRLYRRL
jgi:hypothetical protein